MPNNKYISTQTQATLLAAKKAGLVPANLNIHEALDYIVADWRLIMEHAIEAEKVADEKHPNLQELAQMASELKPGDYVRNKNWPKL